MILTLDKTDICWDKFYKNDEGKPVVCERWISRFFQRNFHRPAPDVIEITADKANGPIRVKKRNGFYYTFSIRADGLDIGENEVQLTPFATEIVKNQFGGLVYVKIESPIHEISLTLSGLNSFGRFYLKEPDSREQIELADNISMWGGIAAICEDFVRKYFSAEPAIPSPYKILCQYSQTQIKGFDRVERASAGLDVSGRLNDNFGRTTFLSMKVTQPMWFRLLLVP